MIPRLRSFLSAGPVGHMDWVRACIGALCGIVLTGFVSRLWLHGAEGLPFLVAPMGASAVLLFAVPASPLARPWSIVGGNTLSAVAGVIAVHLVDDMVLAAGIAVALAIGVMRAARCLHPPGGAAALTAVIGGPAVTAAGWSFALMPVAANSILLLALGWLFNNATRHPYPPRVADVSRNTHGTADPPPQDRTGANRADIDAVLARYDELLDVRAEDLEALFRQVEARATARLHGVLGCDRIMSRDIVTAAPGEGIGAARDRMIARKVAYMPVTEADGRVVGLVGHADLLSGSGRSVADVMRVSPCLVSIDTPAVELLPILSGGVHHVAIVVTTDGHLAGLVTQTDLLASLWRTEVAHLVA